MIGGTKIKPIMSLLKVKLLLSPLYFAVRSDTWNTFEILNSLQQIILSSWNGYVAFWNEILHVVSVRYLDSMSAISSPPFPRLLLESRSFRELLFKRKGGVTLKPLTSGVKLNGFLSSHLSAHPSLHQGCFLRWSAVKLDLIGEELLINNTWPVRNPSPHPPDFLCLPHL